MNFIESCQKFISLDSSPGQGSLGIAEEAASLCKSIGLEVELQSETHNGELHANVIARPTSSAIENELLLQAPLDTIDPGSFGLWSMTDQNPYSATIRDGYIYGLGATSGKLDFLCKLKAIENLKGKIKNFVLVGTFGSEQGNVGALKLLRRKKVLSKTALVGGASDLKAFHAAKGKAAVELRIPFSEEEKEFRKQHDQLESASSQSKMFMSQPSDNQAGNAIVKMMDYVEQLPSGISILSMDGGIHHGTKPSYATLEFDLAPLPGESVVRRLISIRSFVRRLEAKFREVQDLSFDPPFATINLGMVRTRQDYLLFLGTCNVPPFIETAQYEAWMSELKEACTEQGASFSITEFTPPFRTALDSSLIKSTMKSLEELKLDFTPATSSNSSEANIFKRFGMECLLFGAGAPREVDQIPNEKNKISDLELSIQFYEKLLLEMCS